MIHGRVILIGFLWAAGLVRGETGEDRSVFLPSRTVRSTHFIVHHEDPLAPAGVLNVLEGLNSKLLLDLGVFSPWASPQPIRIYLYRDTPSYGSHSGMASYVKAHIRVMEKEVFSAMGPDFQQEMAHELGHLYFSQFFLEKSTAPPLWLNEGIACLMEWDYGSGLGSRDRDRYLRQKGVIPFKSFLEYAYQQAGPHEGERVGMWYAQAESVTRYLLRTYGPRPFYALCDGLRNGSSLDESLRGAYGFALPDTATLERLWIEKLNAPG